MRFWPLFVLAGLAACAGTTETLRPTRQDASVEASRQALELLARGNVSGALARAQRARNLAASVEDEDALAASLLNLSVIHQRLDQPAEARAMVDRILAEDGLRFPPRRIAEAALRRAVLAVDDDRGDEAERLLARAEENCGTPCPLAGKVDNLRAQMAIAANQLGSALELSARGMSTAVAANDEEEVANALRLNANALILLERFAEADARLVDALAIDKRRGASRKIFRDLLLLGICALRQGNPAGARQFLVRAREVAHGDGYPAGIGEAGRWLEKALVNSTIDRDSMAGPALAETAADAADDIDLDEIVRNPAIGNYRGYAEFKMAHYASARRIWEALDARNFGEAGFNLGILYEDGLGVERNIARALAYYRRGAENGSQKAVFRLGVLYWFGAPGLSRDPAEGRHYLALAAADGDRDAEKYLAAATPGAEPAPDPVADADRATAEGRPVDAISILTAAATAGNARAQTRLAWCYEAGRGVDRDLAKAAHWFRRSADAGDGEAMYALAVMHSTGTGQTKDAVAADAWLRKSAAAGYAPALRDLRAR